MCDLADSQVDTTMFNVKRQVAVENVSRDRGYSCSQEIVQNAFAHTLAASDHGCAEEQRADDWIFFDRVDGVINTTSNNFHA